MMCTRAITCFASSVYFLSLYHYGVASDDLPQVRIYKSSSPVVVYSWAHDRCTPDETVDAPVRAFKDSKRRIHLFASHQIWREFSGTSLDNLKYSCRPLFKSRRSLLPSAYGDFQWLGATYTADGRHISVIVHNEFDGNLRKDLCPSKSYSRCWENSLTYARSDNGGDSFYEPLRDKLIAALPYKYSGEIGFPIGYFQPSNIIPRGKYFYVLFSATSFREQKRGTCIMRTSNLMDPKSWVAWDGMSFSIHFRNPYSAYINRPQDHLCAALPVPLGGMGGVIKDARSNAFILFSHGGAQARDGKHVLGIVSSASFDLIHWSEPALVLADPSGATSDGDARAEDRLPSAINDDDINDLNLFTARNGVTNVFFIRSNIHNQPYDRALLRMTTTFSVTLPNQK